MYQTLAVLATVMVALAPMPAVAHGHRPNIATSQLHNLGQELFGSHFEWARGWLNAHPEKDEVVDLAAALTPKVNHPDFLYIPCFNITIPIINKMIFDLIEPCGKVQVPEGGITFKTPFGSKTIPGADALSQEADTFDHECGKYTLYLVIAMVVLYLLVNIVKADKRAALMASLEQTRSGWLAAEQRDPMMTDEDYAAHELDELDPASANFRCPGNIYRLIVILHPGVVGYAQWGKYCVKAGICAYMQLYLPYNIMRHCFKMWQFNGVKSPIYFAMNGASFLMQFGALANVCTLFAAKCASNIEGDAIACHFILSRTIPTAAAAPAAAAAAKPAAAAAPASGATKVTPLLSEAGEDAREAGAELLASCSLANLENGQAPNIQEVEAKMEAELLKEIAPPQWLLDWNEFVWGLVNTFVTNVSAVMLMIAMLMKVATFSGDIMNIALVTVSLYFVFDLDNKVMDSDPNLRGRFRREVLKQTEDVPGSFLWVKQAASGTIAFINAMVPFGLLMIITISWRQVLDAAGLPLRPGEKFTIIGADPFKQ